ncbi:MAG TPA: helicase-associated domain-containing protein [Spirochaetota bacterium]|nr:helicase-associated domain-containing protein [Spirochaetota bacterium]HOM37744.1 helicase-associated domain-containing protein [Spirochaetota bacterium]HPQ49379.1 helicase-associated domain-containing protein [Spirochaetota bacterium]
MKIKQVLKNIKVDFIENQEIKDENIIYSELIEYLKKNIIKILTELDPTEAFIFYHSFINKEGFNPYSDKTKEKTNIDQAIENLENKLLIYKRVSVQNIIPITKTYLFDEIHEILSKYNFFNIDSIIENISKFKPSKEVSYLDMPQDMFYFFYSYGGIVKKEFVDQYFTGPEIEYFKNNGINEGLLYVDNDKIYQVYHIDIKKIYEKPNETVKTISYNTRIFNDIIKIIYTIIKTNIIINKNGKINKKHFEILLKEVSSEVVLNFIIKLLTKYNFIKINEENSYIYPTEKLYSFFQNSIEKIYDMFIETDEDIKEIYNTIKTIKNEEFGIQDILSHIVKKKVKSNPESILKRETRRKVIESIEILFYLGILIKKITTDSYIFYSLNKKYKDISNEKHNNEKNIMVTPNMKIYAYLNKLELSTSYILNIFLDIESYEEICVYNITPESIKRAVYFGNNVEELVKVLKSKSKEIPENVIININNFAKKVRFGKIKNVIIVKFDDPKILDEILLHPIYKKIVIEKISDKHAIVDKEIFNTRIMEDISVYFKIDNL